MASLSSSARIGNTSASSLIRSSSSIQNEINAYNDQLASYKYDLSAKTDSDLAEYRSYLTGRIKTLQSTGSITDASKALTLSRTLKTASHSNTSANIQRENIQIMAGNATLQDKYNVIVGQFQRAVGIGDMSLAQSLESQAYSVSQSIQYQAQQAAAAGETLRNAAKTAASHTASEEGAVVTSLDESLKQLNTNFKNTGEKDFEKTIGNWVKTNSPILKSLGVIIPNGAQPNYFNVVEGVAAAKYNHLVLQAQAQAPYNPRAAQANLLQAESIRNGTTTISTLGGSLTIQEVRQAMQDPNMFAYDYASGQYQKTVQKGYQYIDGQVMPTYTGIVGEKQANQIYYLTPTQTTAMTNLGLNFTMNTTGANAGTTGNGVKVQVTENTPDWLKNILGGHGVTQMFTDSNGNLQFEGSDVNGKGLAYYTLSNYGGKAGLFEHFADGSMKFAGGAPNFDAYGAQLVINSSQQQQYQISLDQAAAAQKIKLAQSLKIPKLNIQTSAPPAHISTVQTPTNVVAPHTSNPQRTINGNQLQGGSPHLQGGSPNLQGGGFNLNQSGGMSLTLG